MKVDVRVIITITKECHDALVAHAGPADDDSITKLPSGDFLFTISWPTFCFLTRHQLEGESDSDTILRVMARVEGKVH